MRDNQCLAVSEMKFFKTTAEIYTIGPPKEYKYKGKTPGSK
jgi:hypothetical protein